VKFINSELNVAIASTKIQTKKIK